MCVCVCCTYLWVCNMWYSQLRIMCVLYAVLYVPACVLYMRGKIRQKKKIVLDVFFWGGEGYIL